MKTHFAHKAFILLFFLLAAVSGKTQIFSFTDTSTTIIKNTNQSPAHWYLEITSNCIVDTTLRWKVHFDNIPPEWNINFDCQNQNWPTILDGDSSDFTMFYDADFPQKLIIGAELNNTPGHGFIYFDIYDPQNPSYVQTISYEYIIGVANVTEPSSPPWLNWNGHAFEITDGLAIDYQLLGFDGKVMFTANNVLEIPISSADKNQPLILHILRDGKVFRLKVL